METNSFLIGEFIFKFNSDQMEKKQLDVKQQKNQNSNKH